MSDKLIMERPLAQRLARWQIKLSPKQLGQMVAHHDAMVEANRRLNLTRITDPAESAVRHYADSLALLAWSRDNAVSIRTLLDVGTGAGFPAVPLAIMKPKWKITAIDGTKKKIDFVRETVGALGLKNLRTVHAHTTHWITDETFDVVAARALAKLSEAIEQSARFVGNKGYLIAYKTASIEQEEHERGASTAKRSGLKLRTPFEYQLSVGDEVLDRTLVVMQRS